MSLYNLRDRRRLTLAAAGALLSLAFVACSETQPVKGQLVLALNTDLALPKDIDTVRIQVRANGADRFDRSYPFGPNENKIPATLTLVAGEDPKQPVEVRVLAFRQGEIRTLSKTITTIPEERTAMLRVPIQWFCYRQAEAGGEDEFRSTCEVDNGPDSACIGGTCVDANVDSAMLPPFEPEVVFGGGESAADPKAECFPTETCFDAGIDVTPDENCEVEVPESSADRLNFAVVTAMAGICSGVTGACYVPLDRTAELGGWSELDAGEDGAPRYALPQAVCERLEDGRGLRVRATRACDAKTASRPTCGEWSSVTEPADPVGAAGASGDAGAGNGDGEGGAAGEMGSSGGGAGGASGAGGDVSTGGSTGIAGGGMVQGGTGGGGGAVGGGTGGASAGNDGSGGVGGSAGAGVAGAAVGGSTSAGGTGGLPPEPFCEGPSEFGIPIDDLEDGDNTILDPRDGAWFAYGDGTSSDTSPAIEAFAPLPGSGAGSSYAAAMQGSGFTDSGAGIGFTLDTDGGQTCLYDGQQYSGMQFQYRSTVPLELMVYDDQRTEPLCSGTCFGNALTLPSSNEFIPIEVNFDDLDYGEPAAPLDRARLTQIRFHAPAGAAFDFAVDDLAFTQVIGQ
jgi:hypothetical protein